MAKWKLIVGPLIALFASPIFADQVAVSSFKYLNSNENSVIIDPSEAQDLLNVDITPGGKSIKKRPGYGLYKTVFTPSAGIHGGYHFFDSTGNDVQIWGSSVSLKGIVADATPTTLVSSATLSSTWDCADTQGNAYCADSNRDALIKTNGATITWYTTPLGTMVESTPDRLVIAGVSATPNTLYFSGSNNFTNFTSGPLSTDPFTEVIASPGSKITHVRWGCMKVLWWKDQSFGYFDFSDQYAASVKIVSDNIGTFDNTSAIDPGGNVWFRGQDGHVYKYDCSGLTRETIEITPQVQISGRRLSNSWSQSSQSDWQAGSVVPTSQLSTTISVGDVTVSSFTKTENSSTDWNSGTATGVLSVYTSSYTVTTASAPMPNPDFEQNSGASSVPTNWTVSGSAGVEASRLFSSGSSCTLTPDRGSWMLGLMGGSGSQNFTVSIWRASDSVGVSTFTAGSGVCQTSNCTWLTGSIGDASTLGTAVKVVIQNPFTGYKLTSSQFTLRGDVSFKYMCRGDGGSNTTDFDNIQHTVSSGTFLSQTFDTGLTSSTFQMQASWTSGNTPKFELLTAASSGGPWFRTLTSTGTNAVGNRYVRYLSSMTANAYDSSITGVTSVTLLSRSTGTLYSQVKNAPNISAWSTFNPSYSNNDGAHSFFMRSSTNTFTVLSTTPSWVAQTAGGIVTASTGTYFQVRDDFSIGAATNTPALNDFIVNWFDGSSADQAYMTYFDNSIWASVAYGVGVSTNNYIFRRDLINDGWTLYYFGSGGFSIQNNHLFFGDVNNGNVYQFASGTSDNGSAINAYWKSKDFTAPDPFMQTNLTQVDVFAKQNTGQSLTATYAMDTSTTTTSYTVNLSTPTYSIIQSRRNIPTGKTGYTFNYQLGDNTTTSAWEVFGFRIGYTVQPWKPTQ